MHNKIFIPPEKLFSKSFTLIELIVVIIIVGILAAVGISQYSLTVEKGRTSEAKTRIGTMRQLAYEYYLNNGAVDGITNADVGVDDTCVSTGFFRFSRSSYSSTALNLKAYRCTGSGKTPNASRQYLYYMVYEPSSGSSIWYCYYTDDNSSCFGLPRWP